MCILQQVFYEGKGLPRQQVFKLSGKCKNELLLLIALIPCMMTDVRAAPLDILFATDASPYAAGICHTFVGQEAIADFLAKERFEYIRAGIIGL